MSESRTRTLEGGDHASFTDHPPLTERSARDLETTRAYVAAFMDRHLRDRAQPLLVGPSAAFPEVAFWK